MIPVNADYQWQNRINIFWKILVMRERKFC